LPDVVKLATNEYRNEEDVIGAFLNDCCVIREDFKCKLSDINGKFVEWLKATRGHSLGWTEKKAASQLRQHGFESFTNDGTWFRGLTLKCYAPAIPSARVMGP
jgi:putative DNA primase/helicase